jgi:signal peptidase I
VSDETPKAPIEDETRGDAAPRMGAVRQVIEFVLTLVLAYFIAQGVRAWVIQPFVVPTGSMLPTIQLSDQVLANMFVYRFRSPQRGEIVVFDNPNPNHPPEEETLIKRVIALGGQTVDLQDGEVVVDGAVLEEPYAYGQPSEPLGGSDIRFPVRIPADSVWLMGDNRTESQDARWFGPVSLSTVRGQAFCIYWPWARIGPLK